MVNLKATGWIFGILWRHNHHSLEEKPHTLMPPGNYIGGNVFAVNSFVGFELSKISFIFTSRIVMIVENQPYLAKMAEILEIVRNRLRRLTLVSFYAEYTTFIQKLYFCNIFKNGWFLAYFRKMAEILRIVKNGLPRLTLASFHAEYTTFIQK